MTGSTEDGDRAELERLFRAHYASLVRFAAGLVASTHAAEDLVQEVFLTVWRRRAGSPLHAIPRAYLYTAVRHRAYNLLRHDRVARDVLQEPEHAVPASAEEDLIRDERETVVRDAIARLPERQRLMFTLNRYEGLSYAEVAVVAGVSIKTVETQMGRALRTLREILSRLEG